MALQNKYVKVTPSTLKSASSKISGYIDQFERDYKQLLTEVETSEKWQGIDAQTYRSQVYGFEDDLKNLVELLRVYESLLTYSATSYEKVQDVLYSMGQTL